MLERTGWLAGAGADSAGAELPSRRAGGALDGGSATGASRWAATSATTSWRTMGPTDSRTRLRSSSMKVSTGTRST
eukprot:15004005-Alexandrium_andersonii.AAC.1